MRKVYQLITLTCRPLRQPARGANPDFKQTVDFYIESAEKRNKLLHLGNKWIMPPDMAKQCFDHMAPLIQLFIALHNTYLAKSVPVP